MPDPTTPVSELTAKGKLTFEITSSLGPIPVEDATVQIHPSGSNSPLEELHGNSSGRTEDIMLPAPPLDYSMSPGDNQPYSNYDIEVTAPGYEPTYIHNVEILPDETAIQNVTMVPLEIRDTPLEINIPPHTLFGDYPPKIPEEELKPLEESGSIVLSRVVIPEYIVVHNGSPSNSSATNYYIPYTSYIKNVVSSEIYATWPESTIYANTLAIMSVTLNRVYTEWYRNMGYPFTITNSTAYDQSWSYGRTIYSNISRIVDSIFNNYLSRPGVRQPIYASYCDGKNSTCRGMTQWGSKYLGDQGYSAIRILRNYYGSDIYINSTSSIAGVPSSWPGYNLTGGRTGQKVLQMQEQLNRIAQNYPAIPRIVADGIYGPKTAASVRAFQGIFGLPQTGVVDYATWYKISRIYVGVSRIAEL